MLDAADNTLAAIGNGEGGTGTTSGNIQVLAGGAVTLSATGMGNARIAGGAAADFNITVTSTGNITLSTAADSDGTTTGGNVFIGNLDVASVTGPIPVGGNITLVSTNGAISLIANEAQSAATVGNQMGTPTGGEVYLYAPGNIRVTAAGAGSVAQIGNTTADNAGSDVVYVGTGNSLTLSASGEGAIAQIGNGGGAGDIIGSVTVSAMNKST